jgi:hypothetical protein
MKNIITLLLLVTGNNLFCQEYISPDFKTHYDLFRKISLEFIPAFDSDSNDSEYMNNLQLLVDEMLLSGKKAKNLAECIAIMGVSPVGYRYFKIPVSYRGSPLAKVLEAKQDSFHQLMYSNRDYQKAIARLNKELVWKIQSVPNGNGFFNTFLTLKKPLEKYSMEILALLRLVYPEASLGTTVDSAFLKIVFPDIIQSWPELSLAMIKDYSAEKLWISGTVPNKEGNK